MGWNNNKHLVFLEASGLQAGSTEVPTAFGSGPFHHNFVVLRSKSSRRPWCLGRWHLALVVSLFWATAAMSVPNGSRKFRNK